METEDLGSPQGNSSPDEYRATTWWTWLYHANGDLSRRRVAPVFAALVIVALMCALILALPVSRGEAPASAPEVGSMPSNAEEDFPATTSVATEQEPDPEVVRAMIESARGATPTLIASDDRIRLPSGGTWAVPGPRHERSSRRHVLPRERRRLGNLHLHLGNPGL